VKNLSGGGATALGVFSVALSVMLAALTVACGGGSHSSPDVASVGTTTPAPLTNTAPPADRSTEAVGPGTGGDDGGDGGLDGEPEEEMPEWVIRDYFDPESGQTVQIIEGRAIIAVKNPPSPPAVDPNYFDDEETNFYAPEIYPGYPPVFEDPEIQRFFAETGAFPLTEWLSIRAFSLYLPAGITVEEAIATWPGQWNFIDEVGPDCFYDIPDFPEDPPNDYCAHYPNIDSWHLWYRTGIPCTEYGMNVKGAWESGALGRQFVRMALADSGVQRSYGGQTYHDMTTRLTSIGVNVGDRTSSSDFATNGGQGWAWVRNRSWLAARTYGHGTNCAGILVGRVNNDPGSAWGGYNDIAGVTVENTLFPVAMKHTTGFSNSTINCAMEAIGAVKRVYNPLALYGTQKGLTVPHYNIEVALVSAYHYMSNKWTRRHFQNLQSFMVFIQPAGNYGNTIRTYPAEYPGAMAVAAYNKTGLRASYSSYGWWVELSGPTLFRSTDPIGVNSSGHTLGYVYTPGIELCNFSGTSAAGPAVAGVALLAQSKYWWWPPGQLRQRLLASRTWLPDPNIPGRLDAVLATE